MSHIPPHLMLPQDMVLIKDLGPEEDGKRTQEPQVMTMHASDARHAMTVEPERYVLYDPQTQPEPEPEAETQVGTAG